MEGPARQEVPANQGSQGVQRGGAGARGHQSAALPWGLTAVPAASCCGGVGGGLCSAPSPLVHLPVSPRLLGTQPPRAWPESWGRCPAHKVPFGGHTPWTQGIWRPLSGACSLGGRHRPPVPTLTPGPGKTPEPGTGVCVHSLPRSTHSVTEAPSGVGLPWDVQQGPQQGSG